MHFGADDGQCMRYAPGPMKLSLAGILLALLFVVPTLVASAQAEPPLTKYSEPRVNAELQKRYRQLAKNHDCPKGIPWLQGTWEFTGQSRVPNFTDVLTIKGAKYSETLSGGRPGREEKGQLTGEIACLFKNRLLFKVTNASPEGLYGNRSGDDFPCDILTPVNRADQDRFLLVCYVDWDLRTAKGLDFEYRRVTTKNKPASPSKLRKK